MTVRTFNSTLLRWLWPICLLGVAACGPSSGGPGTYRAEVEGALVTVSIPARESDERATRIKAFLREASPQTDYTLLQQTLTNAGSETSYMCDPRVVTDTGDTITFKRAFTVIGDAYLGRIDNTDFYNRGVDLHNSVLNDHSALPGATTVGLYVATGTVPSIKSVFSGATTNELAGQGCDTQMSLVEPDPDGLPGASSAPPTSLSPTSSAASTSETTTADSSLLSLFSTSERDLSDAQGFSFNAERSTQWAMDAPLSSGRAKAIGLGALRSVEPSFCEEAAWVAGAGLPKRWESEGIVLAASLDRHEARPSMKRGSISMWQSMVLSLPAGEAATWLQALEDRWSECRVLRVQDARGKRTIDLTDTPFEITRWRSNTALVEQGIQPLGDGKNLLLVLVTEPIGNALAYTLLITVEPDESGQNRVNDLYNSRAEALAEALGATRGRVDLFTRE